MKSSTADTIKYLASQTVDFIKQNYLILGIFILYFILDHILTQYLVDTSFSFLNIIFVLTDFLAYFMLIKFVLQIKSGHKVTNINPLLPTLPQYGKYLVVSFVYGLMIFIGLLLLVVPGIYLAIKYAFAHTFIVDQNTGIKEAFSKSSMMTQNRKIQLLILFAIAFLPMLIMPLTLDLSFILISVWTMIIIIASTILYIDLKRQ